MVNALGAAPIGRTIVAKSIRCRLGFHRWHKEYDKERSIVVKVCQDCEKRMSTGMSGPVVMG